ncbi:MAG: YhgE/Pip domain-containing protein [Microbacterium sp.]|uniref:YhgE/Pip domain-containing protein n=1 Tax=Microbacterium sp. TaxID=51671 RepID=UPI001ACA8197|nr:YhgE/Pip domain-containing protein [Microbacterium sp.]MBN9153791.1 YhgE/Pip domain-containing protein [Microbacterium sp.]
MKIPAMIAAELRRLTATRMSVIALIALVLVPILYGGLYLWANQDPYGKFSEVPVALVVDDEGVAASDDSAATNYGDRVADELLEGNAFDWRRMTAKGAEAALQSGDVDFTVTLPADFSASLASAAGDDPHQARIELKTNDANNYLASTIGDQAVEKIRRSVAELVGKEAAGRLLTAISDIRGKLVTATDGAAQLTDGAVTAASGAGTLATGAASLADGTASLASGAHRVASGAAQLVPGAQQLASGADQVAAGNRRLAGYADQAGTAVQAATDALPAVRQDIADALAAQGLTPTQIADVLAQLDPLADKLRDGNTKVQTAVGQVDRLATGSAQVAAGAARLSAGASQLSSGATQVAAGADAAASGASQVSGGAASLASGLATLRSGAAELRDGLADGVAQIPDSSAALRDAQAKTISDPVAVESSKVAAAGDYGAGLAPFFAALAGWIGIYALFLIVKPISRRAVTALRTPLRVTAAGWLTPAVLGGIQMVGLFGVLALALGFGFANPLGTLGVMVAASFTYAAIILALNVWLGSVGQFLGLVLMVLQLVTAGGTFPWQTLPAPLAALHHVLPMGYVVDAMRQLMYGGDLGRAGVDLLVLAAWLVGGLALAALGVTRMTHRRTLRDLQPSLIG